MNRKIDLVEHIKTAILVVLFLTTILLLYLSFNQSGKSFSISDILPGGRASVITVSVDEYIAPEYTVQSEGNGKFLISYKNRKDVFDTAKQCAASANKISVRQILFMTIWQPGLHQQGNVHRYRSLRRLMQGSTSGSQPLQVLLRFRVHTVCSPPSSSPPLSNC